MQKLWFLVSIMALTPSTGYSQNESNSASSSIYLADPTIFLHDDVYYLYGTNGDPNLSEKQGFPVYTSKDLKTWEGPVGAAGGLALKKGDAFGTKGFWAPQVFTYQDKFFMAYTADEHIAMARAESPLGPFTNTAREDLKAEVKQIDPFLFFDEDGKIYLYHVRLTAGNRIFVAEMRDDLSGIIPGTLTECISGQLPWENTQNTDWPVTEGPTVIKHNGLYYLLYSANDFRNPDYAVGYATSKSPLGPWIKSTNSPLITKGMLGINGTGHGDVFTDTEGEMHYVLHTHLTDSVVHPRRTAVLKMNFQEAEEGPDLLTIQGKTFRFLRN